jgi:hypothetical protein
MTQTKPALPPPEQKMNDPRRAASTASHVSEALANSVAARRAPQRNGQPENHTGPLSIHQFAEQLGYRSFATMFEASVTIVDGNDVAWCLTTDPQRGGWVIWNECHTDVGHRFPTLPDAVTAVRDRSQMRS